MSVLATARRIFSQLRNDRRTVAMVVLLPSLLMILLRYMFNSAEEFTHIAPALLGILPFVVMFLITSVGTLRERTSGTLERLMTMPMGRLSLLAGYMLAFGLLALLQVAVVTAISLAWLGFTVHGSIVLLVVIAVLDSLFGTAFGLFVSAFARSEFQAVQFMPAFALPQILLCGLFVSRHDMAQVLRWVSNVLPLSYAVDAMDKVTVSDRMTGTLGIDFAVVVGAALLALVLGAATLRRRTP
jgi:ABC-2 type transport system permease protein